MNGVGENEGRSKEGSLGRIYCNVCFALMRHSCPICYEASHLSLVHLSSTRELGPPLLEHLRRALTKTVDFWTVFELPDRQTANSVTTPLSSEQIMTLVSLDRLPRLLSCWAAGGPTPSPAAPRPPAFLLSSIFLHFPGGEPLARSQSHLARPLPFLTLSLPGHFWRPRCDCRWVA